MSAQILTYVLGPLENNTYVLYDDANGDAVVIDPSFQSELVLDDLRARKLNLRAVWLTHAHFDHMQGVNACANAVLPALPVGLHGEDLNLYQSGGEAASFGLPFEVGPAPQIVFEDGQELSVGTVKATVLHTPGHTRGHVAFYVAEAEVVFCGDLIFAGGVGRTDLPGGSARMLLASIRRHILTLPKGTRLLSGHGPATTVGDEAATNPFL